MLNRVWGRVVEAQPAAPGQALAHVQVVVEVNALRQEEHAADARAVEVAAPGLGQAPMSGAHQSLSARFTWQKIMIYQFQT